jgi:UDP-GlcNAc3NAcA epimerase
MKMLEADPQMTVKKKIDFNPLIRIIAPVSFLDMTMLEKNCRLIMTDSGGVQKEAFFFRKPCIVLRTETEWVELTENGNNIIADVDPVKIMNAYKHLTSKKDFSYPDFYGNGNASEFICQKIADHIS